MLTFSLDGTFLDPIFFGEYTKSMPERVGDKLPIFSQKDKELLRNSLDFVGLNHSTSRFVSHSPNKYKSDYYSAQEGTRID
ncbi:putative beta-glucosidase [Helianthus annuus]|nr:putative beta-glucosidase [Helianthus annuus]KAJ0544347.1 putative beta-glucosidase [Helianthus annuus]